MTKLRFDVETLIIATKPPDMTLRFDVETLIIATGKKSIVTK